MIHLKALDKNNLLKVIELSETLDEKQKKVVAPNIYSIAEAYVNQERAWIRVVYLEDEPIGFVMVALKDDDIQDQDQPAYMLWRLMISRAFQGKKYGKKVLDLIVEKCREDHIKYLYVSCHTEDLMPYQFYIKYGFVDTHEKYGLEAILKLKI